MTVQIYTCSNHALRTLIGCGTHDNFLLSIVKFCHNRYGSDHLLWYLFHSSVESYEFLENKMATSPIQITFYTFYNIYEKCNEREANHSNYACIKS